MPQAMASVAWGPATPLIIAAKQMIILPFYNFTQSQREENTCHVGSHDVMIDEVLSWDVYPHLEISSPVCRH
jgi:hypothetical protein